MGVTVGNGILLELVAANPEFTSKSCSVGNAGRIFSFQGQDTMTYEKQCALYFLLRITRVSGRVFIYTTVLTVFILTGCSGDDTTSELDCSGVSLSFTTDVYPIILASCATRSACHGSGSNNGPGPLLTYAQVNSAKSDIKSSVASGEMPREEVCLRMRRILLYAG